jgi:hypothetical protein
MQSAMVRSRPTVSTRLAALLFAAGTVACLAPMSSAAAQKAVANEVRWQNNAVTRFEQMSPAAMRATLNAELKGEAQRRMVVQLDSIPTQEQRANLAAKGVNLGSFVGGTSFLATVSEAAAAPGGGVESLRALQPIPFEAKIQKDLLQERVYDWMVIDNGVQEGKLVDADRARDPIVAINVMFHRDVDMAGEARFAVESVGAKVIESIDGAGLMVVQIPNSRVKALASLDQVQWTEAPLPQFTETNANSGARTGAYAAQAAPYNLNGAGVKVLVYDGGQIRTTHQAFQGRAVVGVGDTSASSDHSTHVGCTVAGAGGVVAGLSSGMAPGANIISYGFQVPGGLSAGFLFQTVGDLESDYSTAVATYGAEITTNSIGTNTAPNGFPCDWEGDYGNTSQLIDRLVRGTPGLSNGQPLRVVWANGNERQTATCNDPNPNIPTGYHKTAPPSCAKNHITVGAVDGTTTAEAMSTFSSWGPSDDGRMKPDISAPGVNTVSCGNASDTAIATKSGTSMATPTTTGCLALLLQDYKVQYPSAALPRNSTLKTFLAHTAVDRGNAGPDNQFGYGTIRIIPAIDLMRSTNWKESEVSNGGSTSYLVIVPPGSTDPLKVTLAWDDFPSTPNGVGQGQGSLINDLDLVVTSPSNVRAYPWTLQGLTGNPGAPAVQTAENHVDNIEQVYVANPEPGAWLVTVRGTTVPEGPQSFSVAASPFFVGCSNTGVAGLDKSIYPCGATVQLKVVDCQLNTSNSVVDTVTVNVATTSNPAGVNVVLTEIAAEAADFRGSIVLGSGIAAGNGDTVTLTYQDADTGGGSPGTVTSSAVVDCVGPAIAGVSTTAIGPRVATVNFTTSEPAQGSVRVRSTCGGTVLGTFNTARGTTHAAAVSGLQPSSTYFFDISATDDAGNLTSNDNGGSCFTFSTLVVPDFFTELFTTNNDLDNRTFSWAPSGNVSSYTLCQSSAFTLPVDPTGGTVLALTDDSNINVPLTGGQTVKLYGVAYSSVFVGSNGFLTFTAGDSTLGETYAIHFNKPRVSALFDDLNPTQAGQISYKQLADRFTVTYLNVTEHNGANQNTFQISMYFDGRIEITYLAIAAVDGLAGLSGSTSQNVDFGPSDLSAYPSCGPRPPFASGQSLSTSQNLGVDVTLQGSDDGIPGGALAYTILSLPATALVEDLSTRSNVLSVPYTLSSNQVRFKPQPGFTGTESFTFKVNDNGVAPDGGDSNTATVSVAVSASAAAGLPFSDVFPTTTFDSANWASFGNATIDALGIAEPTEPNSARFNGNPTATGDVITSRPINLIPYTNLRLKYAFECKGGGESPDAGDDLIIEYLNAANTYVEIGRHLGTLPDAVTYTLVDVALPAAAKHNAFRLRIRSLGTAGAFDDWFVDDVSITGTSCPGDTNGDGIVNTVDLTNFLSGFGDIAEGVAGGDFDGNGVTDTLDLTTLLGFFGTNCNTP